MMSYSSQTSEQLLKYKPPSVVASSGVLVPDQVLEDEQTTNSRGKTVLSPENYCTNYVDMNTKHSPTRPTRRRSRASKRTPMVLLNASATNFRALVQQHTGCHSSPSSYKGPINLNFGGGNEESNDQLISKFGYTDSFSHQGQADHQELHHQQLQFENIQPLLEDNRESFFHGGSNATDASLSTNANPATYATSDFDYDFANDLPGDDDVYF